MKKHLLITAVATLGIAAFTSCNREKTASAPTAPAASVSSEDSAASIHQIVLPKYSSDLPDAAGREEFATSCIACHSTAYINMQPIMTAEKWEAEVRKMQATYGCPIAEEQIKPVVSYIMTVKEGTGPHIRENMVAAAQHNPVIKMARDPGDRVEDAKHGEVVFGQYCASCHGVDARGGGLAGLILLPHPADLTAGHLSDDAVMNIVANGIPGTGMASFGKLAEKDLRSVESYVITLCPDDPPAGPPSDEGKQIYMQNCINCHGADGRGDGVASAPLPRPAADFHARRPNLDYAKQVIANGIPGTAMPAWHAKLDEKQRTQVADYVRSFFDSQ
ncbi:MAG TPA: c-type cytochrome [Tepidisphaeraceae bacterium]|jgi:cbb3-type cytochrome c oxidase subunit III|nr:c-type cytochrome [Tepidisphaeraceae bacterium]